jgi:hypothetical protein
MPPQAEAHSTERPAKIPTEDREAVLARAYEKLPPINKSNGFAALMRSWGFRLSPKARRQVAIVSRYQLHGFEEVFSAYYTGLDLAVACTTTQMESSGQMIYGQDPGSEWMNEGPYGKLWEEPVTKANATWAYGLIQQGHTSNGFGIKQLTSPNLIADAMAHGGVWDAQHNCAAGDRFFLSLIQQSGSLWAAFMHYNGSGPAAQRYADNCCQVVNVWRARLG